MPAICCGLIVPVQQKPRNPPVTKPRPNRGATTISPIRALTIPINPLNPLIRPIPSLKARGRLTPSQRVHSQRVHSQRTPSQRVHSQRTPSPTQTDRTQIGPLQTRPRLPDINPITRQHRPISRRRKPALMGIAPIPLKLTVSPQAVLNLLLRHLKAHLNPLLHQGMHPGNLPTPI
jgi:hypothetical protein